jgi:type VI protein secretion system component Hcp
MNSYFRCNKRILHAGLFVLVLLASMPVYGMEVLKLFRMPSLNTTRTNISNSWLSEWLSAKVAPHVTKERALIGSVLIAGAIGIKWAYNKYVEHQNATKLYAYIHNTDHRKVVESWLLRNMLNGDINNEISLRAIYKFVFEKGYLVNDRSTAYEKAVVKLANYIYNNCLYLEIIISNLKQNYIQASRQGQAEKYIVLHIKIAEIMSLLTQIDNAQENPSLEVRSYRFSIFDKINVDIQAERDTIAFIKQYKSEYNKFYLMTEQEIVSNLCDRLIEDIDFLVKWPDWRDSSDIENAIPWSTVDYDLIAENQAYTINVRNIAQTIKSNMHKLYVAINAIHPRKNSKYTEKQLQDNRQIINNFVGSILNRLYKVDKDLYTNMLQQLSEKLKPVLGQEIVVY